MKCPLCGRDMQEGGLIIDGVAPGWVPLEQFNKKGLGRLLYTGLRTIGASNILCGRQRCRTPSSAKAATRWLAFSM
ncbi:MAG: hypothetical protein ACLRWF_07175 [Ruthenibacterium sp.]